MSKSKQIDKKNEYRYIQIGLNIAYYRKLRGYTQEQLAEKIDISRSRISTIEAPKIVSNVSLEILFQIADALDIEPYRLFSFKD